MLLVTWRDGWPVILTGDDTVPHRRRGPSLPRQGRAPVLMSGNFTVRDDFTAPRLAPYWTFIRTPRESWQRVSAGALAIQARPVELGSLGQPSFVGRRQQHAYSTASTAVRFAAARDGDRAGLAAFHDDQHFYLLTVARTNGRRVGQLERRSGAGPATVVASAPLTGAADAPVHLRIQARGDRYDFAYGRAPGQWTSLHQGADGTVLSSKVAGGFVGTMFGMYAFSAP